jgi:hypothetical protein
MAAIRYLLITAASSCRGDRDRRSGGVRTPAADDRGEGADTACSQFVIALASAVVGGTVMSLRTASIAQHCKALRLATVGAQFASLPKEDSPQNHSHLYCLKALLQAESEDGEGKQSGDIRQRLPYPKLMKRPSLATIGWILLRYGNLTFGGGTATIVVLDREIVERRDCCHPEENRRRTSFGDMALKLAGKDLKPGHPDGVNGASEGLDGFIVQLMPAL